MNRFIVRLIAFSLVPCLVTDPVAAFGLTVFRVSKIAVNSSAYREAINTEALSAFPATFRALLKHAPFIGKLFRKSFAESASLSAASVLRHENRGGRTAAPGDLHPAHPRLKVLSDDQFDPTVAENILERMSFFIEKQGHVVVALNTGNTPKGIYKIWREEYPNFEWDKVIFVNLDEYQGLDPSHLDSFSKTLTDEVVEPLMEHGLKAGNVRLIKGSRNPAQEASDHEKFIEDHDGIDIALVGIGEGPSPRWLRIFHWLSALPGTGWLRSPEAHERSIIRATTEQFPWV